MSHTQRQLEMLDPGAAFEAALAACDPRGATAGAIDKLTPAEREAALVRGELPGAQLIRWSQLDLGGLRQANSRLLWAMTSEERVAATWAGQLSHAQCAEWSRRRPREAPKLAREFAWIVMQTREWADARERVASAPLAA